MIFTLQDILDISKKLSALSYKDSQFPFVSTFEDEDQLAILRHSSTNTLQNVKVSFKDAINHFVDLSSCATKVELNTLSDTINQELTRQNNLITGLEEDVQDLNDNKVDKVTGKQLSQEDFTTILKDKLNSIETGANKTIVIDNLTTVSTTYALSAKQGNILLSLINSIKQFSIVKVDTLPETGIANTLYLVPVTSPDTNNYFEEYLWIDSKWELIGTTKVDLTDYYTKEQVNTLLKDPTKLPADSVYMYSDGDTNGFLKANNTSFSPVTIAEKVMLPMGDLSYMTQLQWNQHIHRDKVNNSQIVQGLGSSTTNIPSQKVVTEELDKKLDISAPTVNETVIKAKLSSEVDMFSIMKELTLLSTVEEAHQFFTNIALGYKPVLELYMNNVLYSRTPLFPYQDSYYCIATPFGQMVGVNKDETLGATIASLNPSTFHSTTISVDISAEGTPTFNAGMVGLTGTELINQYSFAPYYGAFSPTLLIDSQSTKYHSELVPLYDASFDGVDNSLTLRFALLNYDNYNIDMLQLVALMTGEVTVSFINWVASNASQVVTMAGGNGGYQTQEQLNTSVLTSLASKANISGSAEQVFNVATPVSDTNAATKAYVDTKSTAFPTLLFDDTQILAGSFDQVLEAYNLNKPFLVLHKRNGPADFILYDTNSKYFYVDISYADIDGAITESHYIINPDGTVDYSEDMIACAFAGGSSYNTFAVASPVSPNDATPKSYVDEKAGAHMILIGETIESGSYDDIVLAYNNNQPFTIEDKYLGIATYIDFSSASSGSIRAYFNSTTTSTGSYFAYSGAIYRITKTNGVTTVVMESAWDGDTGENKVYKTDKVDELIAAVVGTTVEDLTSTTITLTPVANTTYKYGTLSSLTISSIPNSNNPTFIYFTSGTTATTLSYPVGTTIIGYSIPAVNTYYMISIFNGIIQIIAI